MTCCPWCFRAPVWHTSLYESRTCLSNQSLRITHLFVEPIFPVLAYIQTFPILQIVGVNRCINSDGGELQLSTVLILEVHEPRKYWKIPNKAKIFQANNLNLQSAFRKCSLNVQDWNLQGTFDAVFDVKASPNSSLYVTNCGDFPMFAGAVMRKLGTQAPIHINTLQTQQQ